MWVLLQQPHIWKIYLSAEPSQYFVSFGYWLISWTSHQNSEQDWNHNRKKNFLLKGEGIGGCDTDTGSADP